VARSRDEAILELCRNKTVLHLGFVDEGLLEERIERGEWLHEKLVRSAERVIGFDISAQGVARARQLGFLDCYVVDVERLDSAIEVPKLSYDVILAADIIEHVDNPGSFLTALQPIVGPGTTLVITTPNALSLKTFWYPPAKLEVVHPDHNCYFSPLTLTHLLAKYGFEVTATTVYSPKFIPDKGNITGLWDFARKWSFVAVNSVLRHTLVSIFPFFNDGLLVTACKVVRDVGTRGGTLQQVCSSKLLMTQS